MMLFILIHQSLGSSPLWILKRGIDVKSSVQGEICAHNKSLPAKKSQIYHTKREHSNCRR